MSYPEYVDGKPPVVTLHEYDVATWASTTSIDRQNGKYVVVETHNPEKVVAAISEADKQVLDQIFSSAHADFAKQKHTNNVQTK